jgi:hypothetical protein
MARHDILLGEIVERTASVEILCSKCERRGRYHTERLVRDYGPTASLSAVFTVLKSDCPRREAVSLNDRCDVYCPDLAKHFITAPKPGSSGPRLRRRGFDCQLSCGAVEAAPIQGDAPMRMMCKVSIPVETGNAAVRRFAVLVRFAQFYWCGGRAAYAGVNPPHTHLRTLWGGAHALQ